MHSKAQVPYNIYKELSWGGNPSPYVVEDLSSVVAFHTYWGNLHQKMGTQSSDPTS